MSDFHRASPNIELLQNKCSDFRFNLPKVKIHNTCYVSISPVRVFFFNLFSLMKRNNYDNCNIKLLFLSYMHVAL